MQLMQTDCNRNVLRQSEISIYGGVSAVRSWSDAYLGMVRPFHRYPLQSFLDWVQLALSIE